jgi:hypothetical protein
MLHYRYALAVRDLELAEPVLKSANVADKILELRELLKRKHGGMVTLSNSV